MAIIPEDLYTLQITPGNANYPLGSARNITSPGDGLGTPLDLAWINDIWGFLQKLLDDEGIVADGNADTVLLSQYMEALTAKVSRTDNDLTVLNAITTAVDQVVMNHVFRDGGAKFLSWSTVDPGGSVRLLNIMFAYIINNTSISININGPVDAFNLIGSYIEACKNNGIIFGLNVVADQDDWKALNINSTVFRNIAATAGQEAAACKIFGKYHSIVNNVIDNIVGAAGEETSGIASQTRYGVFANNRIDGIVEGSGSTAWGIKLLGQNRLGAGSGPQGFANVVANNIINLPDNGIGIESGSDDHIITGNLIEGAALEGILHAVKSVNRVSSIGNTIVSLTKPVGSIGISANINGQCENVSENIIDNQETGIYVGSTLGKSVMSITGNKINDCDDPIVIDPTGAMSELIITNNVIKGSGTNAIRIDGTVNNLIIKDNIIDGYTNFVEWLEADAPTNYLILQDNLKAQTTDNTPLNIFSLPLAEETAVMIKVTVIALQTNGVNRGFYERIHTFYRRTAGNVTAQSVPDSLVLKESDSTWDVAFFSTATEFGINVKGNTGLDITWNLNVEISCMQVA